jgi:trehalose 6-phosphate phosphatase
MSERPPLPAASASWALFLDVDGTLLETAERPDAVQVDASLGALLARLQRATGGALALISGRAVDDLDALFAPLELAAAGQHGLERRDASGELHLHPFPMPALRRAAARLAEFAAQHSGLLLEDKGRNLALHYRQAPQLAAAACGAAAAAAAEMGGGFELQAGKMVIEIKPGGRDKGLAIEEFMREPPFRGRSAVFVGDDLTDEYGFGVVNRLGGHSVKVGAGPSAARWRLADAAEVRAWLAGCAAALLADAGQP